jgi:integrase
MSCGLSEARTAARVRIGAFAWTRLDSGEWQTYWVENIAAAAVRENTLSGYRVAVNVHLIPGVGAHRLDRLEPEHLERLYSKMIRSGSAPATAHQAHRTVLTALGEAERRGRITRNPAKLAKAPRPDDVEVEPYTVDQVRQLLKAAGERRNSARWGDRARARASAG